MLGSTDYCKSRLAQVTRSECIGGKFRPERESQSLEPGAALRLQHPILEREIANTTKFLLIVRNQRQAGC